MKKIIENVRYLPILAVIAMFLGAITSLAVGIVKTLSMVKLAFVNINEAEPILYYLFEALDFFLVSTALIVLGVSLYELFIGVLEVPDWMLVKDLTELKAKFTFVIVPVMAVKFVQKILKFEDAVDTLYYGLAISVVTLALTLFNWASIKEKEAKIYEKEHDDGNEKRAEDIKNNKAK